MLPSLTWLDLTSDDRERMRRVLDLFGEQGTVDELGLGSLRDAISDELFPGTSTIQTRLRYFLFVPWIYRDLECRGLSSDEVADAARRRELDLISPLVENTDSDGVIGSLSRDTLRRLPSTIYWAGLVRWGIFRHARSLSWYHRNFASLADRRAGRGHADDPGVTWSREPTWHSRLPDAPSDFRSAPTFGLRKEESDFLEGRIAETCAGSLLAHLAREGVTEGAEYAWDDPTVTTAPPRVQEVVELGRRFSLHVVGAPLLYNLLLAEKRHAEHGENDDDLIEKYRAALIEWAGEERAESAFEPDTIWNFVTARGGRIPRAQRLFLEAWTGRMSEIDSTAIAADPVARRLIAEREAQLKGPRARLQNTGRLLDWRGSVGVGRMSFRWRQAQQLLLDLHGGREV